MPVCVTEIGFIDRGCEYRLPVRYPRGHPRSRRGYGRGISSATRCVFVDDSALVNALWDELANQLERRLGDHREVNAVKAGLSVCEFVTPRLLVECQFKDFRELTIHDAITDPLISLLNEADGVNSRAFTQLLESAARVLAVKC